MSLCLVAGVSGTGKSAVLRELRVRGCLARGVDEVGYADWVSRRTGAAEVRSDPDFDIHRVALVADGPTTGRRLAARAGDYGKAPEGLAMILGWHDGVEESYQRFGAVIVDAGRPLQEVTDQVLAAVPTH